MYYINVELILNKRNFLTLVFYSLISACFSDPPDMPDKRSSAPPNEQNGAEDSDAKALSLTPAAPKIVIDQKDLILSWDKNLDVESYNLLRFELDVLKETMSSVLSPFRKPARFDQGLSSYKLEATAQGKTYLGPPSTTPELIFGNGLKAEVNSNQYLLSWSEGFPVDKLNLVVEKDGVLEPEIMDVKSPFAYTIPAKRSLFRFALKAYLGDQAKQSVFVNSPDLYEVEVPTYLDNNSPAEVQLSLSGAQAEQVRVSGNPSGAYAFTWKEALNGRDYVKGYVKDGAFVYFFPVVDAAIASLSYPDISLKNNGEILISWTQLNVAHKTSYFRTFSQFGTNTLLIRNYDLGSCESEKSATAWSFAGTPQIIVDCIQPITYTERYPLYLLFAGGNSLMRSSATMPSKRNDLVFSPTQNKFLAIYLIRGPGGQSYPAGLVGVDTTITGNQTILSSSQTINSDNPQVGMSGDETIVLVWEGTDNLGNKDIYARLLSGFSLNPLSTEFKVNRTTLGDQLDPSVAVHPDGRFFISWTSHHKGPGNAEIMGQAFTKLGLRSGTEMTLNKTEAGDQVTSTVTFAGSKLMTAWVEIISSPAAKTVKTRILDPLP